MEANVHDKVEQLITVRLKTYVLLLKPFPCSISGVKRHNRVCISILLWFQFGS